jgi:hypothetical protein
MNRAECETQLLYFVGIAENQALPAAGRTLIGTASYRF